MDVLIICAKRILYYNIYVSAQTAAVLNDCKDNNKRNVQKGTILYNLSTYKVLRKKGIRGETSDGVGHKFPEGVDTLFSIRYHDIRCNLAEIDEVCKSSLRARVISEGESELKCNNVVVFEKKMERVIMIQKVNSKGDLSSSPFPFPIDSGDLKVSTSNLSDVNILGGTILLTEQIKSTFYFIKRLIVQKVTQ